MKHTTINRTFLKMFMLITLCFTAFGFSNNLGLDTYEVYLNEKLLLKHAVNQPLNLRKLQLSKAANDDQLRIIYTHCNTKSAGLGRSITVKDEKGTILKKWEFADATSVNPGMTIPVKELLLAEKASPGQDLRLYYTAKEMPKPEMLAALQF